MSLPSFPESSPFVDAKVAGAFLDASRHEGVGVAAIDSPMHGEAKDTAAVAAAVVPPLEGAGAVSGSASPVTGQPRREPAPLQPSSLSRRVAVETAEDWSHDVQTEPLELVRCLRVLLCFVSGDEFCALRQPRVRIGFVHAHVSVPSSTLSFSLSLTFVCVYSLELCHCACPE